MASPTVYKWTDPSAPVLDRGSSTSLQALFQACLIDGYGSKTPPATGLNQWTIPFSDASGFILKQGGTQSRKCCLKLNGFATGGYYCEMEAAVDYTDLNTPVDVWAGSTTNDRMPCGYSNTTTNKVPWIILATERTLICLFGHNAVVPSPTIFDNVAAEAMNCYHWYFGDYVPEDPALTVNQMVSFANANTIGTNYRVSFTTTAVTVTGKKRCSGSAGNITGEYPIYPMYLRAHDEAAVAVGGLRTTDNDPRYPNLVNGGLYLDKVKLVSQSIIMGEMAGVLFPIQSKPFPSSGIIHEIDGTGDYTGETIYVCSTGDGQFMLRDGDWGVD